MAASSGGTGNSRSLDARYVFGSLVLLQRRRVGLGGVAWGGGGWYCGPCGVTLLKRRDTHIMRKRAALP